MISHMGKFFDESTLVFFFVFFCFSFVRNFFATSGVWIFGFQSIQIRTYVRTRAFRFFGPKRRGFQRVDSGWGNAAFLLIGLSLDVIPGFLV